MTPAGGVRTPRGPVLPPWPGSEQVLDGQRLHVRSTPVAAGQPAVFVHGLGGSATNWTDLMGLLSGSVSADQVAADDAEAAVARQRPTTPDPPLACRAVDLPGFGYSPPPRSGRLPFEVHLRAVAAVLREASRSAGGAPVDLFGNSLGGAVAIRVAARHPDLVRSLVLVSPALPVWRPPPGMDPRALLLVLPGLDRLVTRRLAAVAVEHRAWEVARLCYAQPERIAPLRRQEAVEEVRRRDALGYDQRVFAASLRGLLGSYARTGRASAWSQARRVTAPVLMLWGEQDRLVPVAVGHRAMTAFRHARLVTFPDVGHVAQLEVPVATAAAVTEFLSALSSADIR